MKLSEAVDAEMDIWKLAYPRVQLQDGCTFFYEKAYPQHPYWNLLSGPSNESIQNQFSAAKKEAQRLNVNGHFLQYGFIDDSKTVSIDKYFYCPKDAAIATNHSKFKIELCDSLLEFSEIVGLAFNFDHAFTQYFCTKLTALSAHVSSQHFCLRDDNEIIGTWSLYESKKYNADFLMNVSINPNFHSKGLSYQLVEAILSTSSNNLITHTSSTALMEKVFPAYHFVDLGQVSFLKF